jgi:hypothetical protein
MLLRRLGWKGLWREFERDYFLCVGFTKVQGAWLKGHASPDQSATIYSFSASEFAEVSIGQKSDPRFGEI